MLLPLFWLDNMDLTQSRKVTNFSLTFFAFWHLSVRIPIAG